MAAVVVVVVVAAVVVVGREKDFILDGVCLNWPGQHINRTARHWVRQWY